MMKKTTSLINRIFRSQTGFPFYAAIFFLATVSPVTMYSGTTETNRITEQPAGGDANAQEWKVVSERWVRNYYEDGSVTMTDRESGLMWKYDAGAGGSMSLKAGLDYCDELRYAGYDDWFLPRKEHLRPMASQGRWFANIQDAWYWSATPAPTRLKHAVVVGIGDDATSVRYGDQNFFRLPGVMNDQGYIYSYHLGNRNWIWPCREIK